MTRLPQVGGDRVLRALARPGFREVHRKGRHVMVIHRSDPLARTLEIYRLEEGRWIVVANHGGDDRVRAEPFDAIEIALERWWLESTATC